MQKAINFLMDSLAAGEQKEDRDIYPAFRDKRYKPFALKKDNIHELFSKDHDKKVTAVDGGNIEIIKSPDTSIHLVRLYFNIFRNKKRTQPKTMPTKIDFYALARSFRKNTEIYYRTKLIPLDEKHHSYLPDEKDLVFDSYDPTITTGSFRTHISRIGEISRKFAEWKISGHIIDNELESGDIILRDGSLQTGITNESTYSLAAYKSAEKKGVIFCGISKTSALLADNGKSLTSSISSIAESIEEKGAWYYHPIARSEHPDHRAEIYHVLLNVNSAHNFRFEIYDKQKDKAIEAIEQLASLSQDISFPGYPYPLIDADKNARVRFQEISFHKTMIEHNLQAKSALKKEILSGISAQDAHSVIDSIV